MSKIAFQYKDDGSLVLFVNGGFTTIDKTSLNYDIVLKALIKKDYEAVEKALTVRSAVADLTDGRVEIFGEEVYVDKQPIHKALSSRISAMFQDGLNLTPMLRFLENVAANPEQYSRDELYLFLEQNDLPFTLDGHFLAYKMVDNEYKDLYTHEIDNRIGAKPWMKREDVDPVRNNTCSRGFHFCSFAYLTNAYVKNKSNHLMVVKINPADVVSIPSDYGNAKGRCWQYEVVAEIPFHDKDALTYGYSYNEEEEELEESEEEEESESWDEYSEYEEPESSEYEEEDEDDEPLLEEDQKPNYTAKLDEYDVVEIRRMLKEGWTLRLIADTFDVSSRQIARIRDGQAWTNVK